MFREGCSAQFVIEKVSKIGLEVTYKTTLTVNDLNYQTLDSTISKFEFFGKSSDKWNMIAMSISFHTAFEWWKNNSEEYTIYDDCIDVIDYDSNGKVIKEIGKASVLLKTYEMIK